MANEKMTALWGKLTESGLKNKSLSEFEADMNDYNNRYTLWQNLSKHPKYNKTFDEFTSDMGIMSNEQTEQTETPAPLIQEEPQQKSSNATYWQSIGAHNPYPTIQKPDKEIKMSEVVRPKDYTGQSNDGSIESLLSSSFYNLSDEELSSQMKQLQKELDAPMEPVYGAFKAQTGREYDRSGKNNSHGDEVRLDNILNSMKAAELAKRGYYDANSSMRRAKIKKEVDDLFDDNSGNGKEIKERLSRLSAEKAWRERQGAGKQVILGKALSEQQKEIQRLQESGPTNMSLRGAQKYLDDAIAEYNAPSKYGPENGFVNWAGGLGSQLSNYDTWTAGVTEMARAIDLKNIVEKMNTGKSLPPVEQAKLDAFLLYNLVQESRQEDISSAYSIGKGTAESIPFMAEMFITAGIGAAGKKLIVKSLLKKGNKEAAEKIARIFGYKIDDIAEDKAKKEVTDFALKEVKQGAIERSARQIGQDVAMTAAMPTTWTAISEDKVNKILNRKEYGFKDFLRTFAGQTIETGTEHWGGKIVDKALGRVMPLDKIWGKTRWGKIFTNDFIQSPLGETGEEYVGAAVNYIRSLNPVYSEKSNEELRAETEHMFSPEGFTQTFLTVLPMSVLGGAGNVISHKKTINTYKKSKNNLISMLTDLGATNEQAQTIFTSIEGSSDTQGFTEKLQYMVGALKTQYQEQHPNASLEEMEEYFNKLDKVVGDYYRSAYYLNELGGEIQSAIDKMDETEKQQVKQDFENEVKQQITNPSVTQDSDKNLEVLSTGNKPIEFKINVTEETRESGKTSDVTKEVKVSFRSNAYSYANDGSIISDKFSLLANGSPLSGKKKEEYFGLINDQLRAEKAKADEKTAQERADQEQLEQEREAQAQQIAQKKAAAEQKKKQLRETTPMKEGVVDTESSKTTPAHIFLWNLDNHGQEEAIKRAARAVGESIYAKEKLEEDTKMSSTKRDAEIDRANMRIAAYEQAVKDFVGETDAQQLRQDAEGQVALLLQRDMENAKEEERVRLERIAEKQRIKEENRKLYRTNLDNQKDNNNFAQNSNDNGNNEGTNRELQEGSGSGVLETAGNGQTQSGGNQQGNEDIDSDTNAEDNGYDEAGEYRDNVLSGEVTQEKETPEEESTSQDQDTSKEVQQEPIDLTADNVVMMVHGATSTRTTYTFARHEVDEDGNDVYINLGCPFGSKSINGNIGRKLSTKTWAVTDKSKKLFYVKDAYGTPFACYAITSEDISNKKFSRESSKLNAVVAKTGEPLYGVTSMQDAYIMQGDKEVSILKDKKQHGNKIKAESIESLLRHKVVIRFASEAKGEKEISVTLYDLLYGEFASDVNNFAKAREFTNVEAVNSGYGAGLYTGLLKDAIMDMAKAWNEYCSNNGLKNIKPDLSKLSQQDRDLFWFARQEMNRENREEADKASMEVQTSVPAKTMGDSNGIYNNPLHQLGVMLYIANKLGYVQGEVYNNLPGKVRQVAEGKHIITKEVIEKVRERYDALKSGKATVNIDKFETEKQEMEYYEKYYFEVLNDEPAHNRLAITDDNSRKKALKNIHDSKLREEAAKEVAKEEKKETPKDKSEKEPAAKKKESSKEKVDNNTSILDEIVTTGFERLDKALADGDQTKQEEIIQQLNVIIAGNAEYQDRLAKMLADAEAKKIKAEVLQKKIAEQEKAKSETEEIVENSYNAVDAISEEVPAPTKRRKKNRQPVRVEAEKVEKTLEAAPIQEAVAEPDVVSETESTEEQPMTVEAVEETAVQDDANITFDASSLEGKSEKELKDRQSDLYLKDELQGLTKEEELELAAIKERLGGAKVYKGYEGTKQSDRNKGMSNDLAFSVSPQQRAQTARSRVLGEMMMRVLGRIKGIKVHVLNSKEDVIRVLARFGIAPEFMSAYHGTDARFDKFDLSFVGNGEGAQAYGFGVYVSRNENVARGYARRIKKSKEVDALYNDAVKRIILADDMGNLYNKNDVYGELLYGKRSIASHTMSLMTEIQDPEFKKRFGEIIQGNEGDMFAIIRALDSYAEEEFSILKGGKMNRLSAEDKGYIRFLANSRMQLDNYDALWQELIDFESTEDKTLADMVEFVKQKEFALLYSVDIPDDNGENYLAWNERLTDKQLDKIYKAFPQFKYQVDGTPTGETVYEALQAYIQRIKRRAQILLDGIPDNLLKGGKLYEELREYAKRRLPGVPEDVDEAVDNLIDGLYYGLSIGSLEHSIDTLIMRDMSAGGLQRIFGEWLYENKDRFSTNLSGWLESNRLDEAASKALSHIGFKGIKVPINYLHSGGRNARSNEDYNYILFNDSDVKILKRESVEYLKTPEGTIYGFAIGDEIYITQEGLNANTPIHEYTHLWVKALRSNEPKAWKKIVGELKKNKALWESVTKNEAYKDLEGDDAIASEVFARYVGDKGEALLEELAKKQKFGNEKLEEAFINRVKRSLRGFWERVLNLLAKPFGLKYNFKPKNIDEFANLTLRDLFDGKELDVEDTRINEEIESIKQKAIDNGTFMKAPNGQPSNLPEKLWLLVRTKNFKNWFGDWENDPLHASKVVDENGEPMVVYHGTGSAGFETFRLHSESDANTGSRGFFTTENRRVASVYTRDSWTEMPSNAQDAILGADPHEAVYSLFMNMRNPMVVDFADENGNKRHWNEYPTNRWVVAGDEQLGMEDAEFSSEEEANEYLSQFGSSDKPIHVMLTTDDFLRKANEVGFDGCIFKNVYDGNFTMGEEMTDYVALSPNQLKSTNNKGYFSTIDDRIEYQYAEDELTQLDEHAEELIREQEEKGNAIQLDPDLSEQERESWWESVVTRIMDQSNGMRLMLESINAYRKVKGLEPLDGDKYDVRTKFDACNNIINNKIGFLERGIQQELDDTIREFAKVVEDSQFYKDHKKEKGGENPTTLTPVEFIERYLIALNNCERAKEGKPRGIAEFKDRMRMGVIEFSNAFTEAYGKKVVLNLWDKIRQMTDFALDTNLEGGLISEEMHAKLKAKKFYVPQRGFWDDVNGENDRKNEEDILKRRTRGSRTDQNKLDSMHKAEGGKSLAEGCLAYIARDARQAIKLSEENKVKKVMFDLLRDNEDWCHEPEHGFKVPRQAFFYTDENGDIQMMDDGPTPEQVQEMRMLKNIVKQLREEYKRATTKQEREEIAAEIEETESLYPYFDEKDSWRIMHSRVSSQYDENGLRKNKDAKKAKAIIELYVNGVPCEIEMTPRFVRVADALNGRRDMRGEFSAIKSVTSWLSAQYTINNPTFFAVNITRDTPYIITKGATEYGPEFSIRFTANWAASQKAIWKYLITGEIDDTDIGAQLLDFLNNGGNTGYSNLEELQKFRNHVKDLNPGGLLKRLQRELSTVEGAANVGNVLLASVGKGTVKFGDKLLGWSELRPLAQVLNEWSEIISRFSAYKSVVDMGLGVNEGIKAAHNLSTNFNRRGLGAPFTNFFNSLSVFANAGIQGASGYWRTLKSNDGKALKKIAKTAAYMGMMPAFLGFLSTMLSPDDDDKEYTPSQYERDNYIVIGDMRIALNEQLKPWWCIGVNIAQLLRGRRTLKQATNSVVTSVITNWLPVAQNIKEPISMMVDNATSQEEWNIAQIARTAIMPSAMQPLNQWADNKNFLGGKLRYDIGDIPEYEMAPNEAALYQDLARALYVFGGGNEKVPSKTKDDGTKLRKLWDVNPKEIRSNLFWIPSGALDMFCLEYGIYKDIKEKIEGDYKGTNVRVKDLPIINRFYKPNDNTLYRYAIVREVRAMVKQHNDRISNLEKQAAHFEDIYNHTSDPSAKESYNEAKRLIKEAKNDAVLNKLRILIGRYNNISIRSFQNELRESKKEVESYHGEAVGGMNLSEQVLVRLMLQGLNTKKGLKHSKDVPEWIEWFDEHSPSQKESREE